MFAYRNHREKEDITDEKWIPHALKHGRNTFLNMLSKPLRKHVYRNDILV